MIGRKITIVSAFHDYRTAKRASIQPLAEAFRDLGHHTSFVSTRFSYLSRYTGDSRLALWPLANRVETVAGIDCLLWRTPFHPFNTDNPLVRSATDALFPLYAEWPDKTFDRLQAEADYIIIESSIAVIYVPRIRRLNPRGKIIYYGTDRLDTHGAHPYVIRHGQRYGKLIDHYSVRSPRMVSDFPWAKGRVFLAPFGIHKPDFDAIGPNPYRRKLNAVSAGSGLFDPEFFQLVAPHFPEIDFHVIGCGMQFNAGPNVLIYPEKKFAETLPFLKHATIGLAPYRLAPAADYIADTSLKLAQYEYLGLPAVCPEFAAMGYPHRCAYILGDVESMKRAMTYALEQAGRIAPRAFHNWTDVARRVLEPAEFLDTILS